MHGLCSGVRVVGWRRDWQRTTGDRRGTRVRTAGIIATATDPTNPVVVLDRAVLAIVVRRRSGTSCLAARRSTLPIAVIGGRGGVAAVAAAASTTAIAL